VNLFPIFKIIQQKSLQIQHKRNETKVQNPKEKEYKFNLIA
jgi:hypothetical protein